jgi:hypothetical protein
MKSAQTRIRTLTAKSETRWELPLNETGRYGGASSIRRKQPWQRGQPWNSSSTSEAAWVTARSQHLAATCAGQGNAAQRAFKSVVGDALALFFTTNMHVPQPTRPRGTRIQERPRGPKRQWNKMASLGQLRL